VIGFRVDEVHITAVFGVIFSGTFGCRSFAKAHHTSSRCCSFVGSLVLLFARVCCGCGLDGMGWEGGRFYFYTKSRLSGHPNRRFLKTVGNVSTP